jgi:DNA-binding LacI/PurR family transcriptional regulator
LRQIRESLHRSSRRVTITDVARLSGVSKAVVSQVLSGRKNSVRCSPATAQRVREIARSLFYRPAAGARIIRERQTRILGVVLPVSAEAYLYGLLPGSIERAVQLGYELLVTCASLTTESYEQRVSCLLDRDVDGLILFGSKTLADSPVYKELTGSPRPVVLAEHEIPNAPFDFVGLDDLSSYHLVIDHLRGLGHSRIGFIYEAESQTPSAHRRRLDFEKAIDEAGLPVLPRYYQQISYHFSEEDERSLEPFFGKAGSVSCLVVRGHDRVLWVHNALTRRGIRVPEDRSIVNISVHDYRAEKLQFTSVRTPVSEIGRTCVELLVKRIQDPQRPLERILLKGTFAPGETTVRVGPGL